jgi:hypothetical protein
MSLFTYKLEQADGTPADPAVFQTAMPNWRVGDTIPLPWQDASRHRNA